MNFCDEISSIFEFLSLDEKKQILWALVHLQILKIVVSWLGFFNGATKCQINY